MWPALPAPEYYGGSAPPGPFSGRRAYPRSPGRMPGRGEPAPGGSRVHRDSLVEVGARLCPSGRHGYAAALHRGLPGQGKKARPEVPSASTHIRTRRTQPVSTRFELVHALKGVMTPVPRVLLFVSLAGPAPSGSPGHVPALSGLLPPSPAPPGSGCPQLQRPAATGRRRRSLTSTRITAPHGARRKAWKPLVMVLVLVDRLIYQGLRYAASRHAARDQPVSRHTPPSG
jgi:hypothetical protein